MHEADRRPNFAWKLCVRVLNSRTAMQKFQPVFTEIFRMKERDLNLKYGDIEIKQHCRVTYLGCILDNILSGEHMAAKVLNTVNNRLKFLHRKQKFLSLSLRRLLCNALIQPHFDYACVAWYPLLNKRQAKRIQIAQNKCIRYCLNLDNKAHIGMNEFLKIN